MIQPPLHVPSVTTVLSHATGVPSCSKPRLRRVGAGSVGAIEHAVVTTTSDKKTASLVRSVRMHNSIEGSASNADLVGQVPISYGQRRDVMGLSG
jgi:hypothetical protein